MKYLNIYTKLALLLLLFIFLPNFIYGGLVYGRYQYQTRWYYCIELLEQGKLYQGEPLCEQAPPVFITSYLGKLLFGSLDWFQYFSMLFFNIAIFFLTNRIIKKETEKEHFILHSILHTSLVYIPSLTANNYDTMSSAFYFLLGFYILFYTVLKHKELLSGSLFALAIFTEIPTIIPIGLSILYYLYPTIKNRQFNQQLLKTIYAFSIPSLLLFLIFYLTLPNFLFYSLTIAVISNTTYLTALSKTISAIFSFKAPIHSLMLLIAIASLVEAKLIKKKYFIQSLFLVSLIIFLFLFIKADTAGISRLDLLPQILPFFFIALASAMVKSKRKLIYLFLIVLLLSIQIYPLYYTYKLGRIAYELSYPLSFLDTEGKKILTEEDRLKMYKPFYSYDVDMLNNAIAGIYFDESTAYRFKKFGLKPEDYLLKRNIDTLREWTQKLKDYNTIIYKGVHWRQDLLVHLLMEEKTNKTSILNSYCRIFIPSVDNILANITFQDILKIKKLIPGDNETITYATAVVFKSREECEVFGNEAIEYYLKNYERFCTIDPILEKYINYAMVKHVKDFNRTCQNP